MKNKLFLVALIVSPVFAHFLSITSAYADAIYDPATGTITLTSVLAGDGSSQTESIYATNVQVTAGEILSMGKAWPPYIHPSPWPAEVDFYDMATQELKISYIRTPDTSIELNDVVIKVGSVLGAGFSESISAGVADYKFRYVLDESLPNEWKNEFEKIMNNLQRDIPIYAKSKWYSMPVFAWKSDSESPLPFVSGGCICGGGEGGHFRWMSLEISASEFEYNQIHRYSLVPHEYFHVYQLSHVDLPGFKWLMEGPAATLESIYVQEHYGIDYFSTAQGPNLSEQVRGNPSSYESYSASRESDINYSGSVFMTLILSAELQKQGLSEVEAYRKVFRDFNLAKPTLENWEAKFLEVFLISVDSFYSIIKTYELSYDGLLPSEDLKISQIFSN